MIIAKSRLCVFFERRGVAIIIWTRYCEPRRPHTTYSQRCLPYYGKHVAAIAQYAVWKPRFDRIRIAYDLARDKRFALLWIALVQMNLEPWPGIRGFRRCRGKADSMF